MTDTRDEELDNAANVRDYTQDAISLMAMIGHLRRY